MAVVVGIILGCLCLWYLGVYLFSYRPYMKKVAQGEVFKDLRLTEGVTVITPGCIVTENHKLDFAILEGKKFERPTSINISLVDYHGESIQFDVWDLVKNLKAILLSDKESIVGQLGKEDRVLLVDVHNTGMRMYA